MSADHGHPRHRREEQGGGTTVSVAIAEGRHPVPFRTRKLSPPAPMVLPWRRGGRVGRRRDIFATREPPSGGSRRFRECEAPVPRRLMENPREMREVVAAVEKNERHPGTSCWETSS